MKLEKAIFYNRAPFDYLELNFSDNINVLSGFNGSGKTTILSHIVDSFYELARNYFSFDVVEKNTYLYRISSSLYNLNNNETSLVIFLFKNNEDKYLYLDAKNKIGDAIRSRFSKYLRQFECANYEQILSKEGFLKTWVCNDKEIDDSSKTIFSNNLLTYFPSYRYESPGYLTNIFGVKLNFNKTFNIKKDLINKIEVESNIEDIANWIMDVVLDREIYRKNEAICNEDHIFELLNRILNTVLLQKTKKNTRFGIGKRNYGATRIGVMNKDNDQDLIYPSIFQMSSGELALLSIFGEIIKQSDKITNNYNDLLNVKGIVLIDEIDKHLHLRLQKEHLPKLLKIFQNIQFIASSHSPFLNLGLSEIESLKYKIFDLNNNGIETSPEDTTVLNDAYLSIIKDNKSFKIFYQNINNTLNNKKILIITEGKTDWKHLKNAYTKLNITNLNIEFFEYEQPLGDKYLLRLLKNDFHINNEKRIIGIFDRDNFDELRDENLKNDDFVKYADNIYGFGIPLVNQNEYGDWISIEHYYDRINLTKTNSQGRRLFLGDEFYESGISRDKQYFTKISQIKNKVKVNGIIDEKVYLLNEDPEGNNNLAMKKDDFANLILSDDEFSDSFNLEKFKKIFDIIKIISDNS